jgi:hypothetical protein
MSMFTINGLVTKVFTQPGRTDDKTGEVSEPKHKVQVLGEMPTQSGESRMELVTLTCEDRRVYESLQGKQVSLPMGVFCPSKGQVIYYIPKGGKPTLLGEAPAGAGRSSAVQ